MNTHETYVSLETAKLLKEVGFDWGVQSFYIPGALRKLQFIECGCTYFEDCNRKADLYSAPTLNVAQRWLREVKNIQIIASPLSGSKKWTPLIAKDFWLLHEDVGGIALTPENFDTYELALEAGIQKCLTMLTEQK
jgi:hypothetical protein